MRGNSPSTATALQLSWHPRIISWRTHACGQASGRTQTMWLTEIFIARVSRCKYRMVPFLSHTHILHTPPVNFFQGLGVPSAGTWRWLATPPNRRCPGRQTWPSPRTTTPMPLCSTACSTTTAKRTVASTATRPSGA